MASDLRSAVLPLATARDPGGRFTAQVPAWAAAFSTAGAMVGVYHGYQRNNASIFWALGWGLFGALVPVVAIPLALAQGIGTPLPPALPAAPQG